MHVRGLQFKDSSSIGIINKNRKKLDSRTHNCRTIFAFVFLQDPNKFAQL